MTRPSVLEVAEATGLPPGALKDFERALLASCNRLRFLIGGIASSNRMPQNQSTHFTHPVTEADIWLAKNVMQWTHRENGWVDLDERFMASDSWSPTWTVGAARQVLTEFLAAFPAPDETARSEWPSWWLVAEVDPLLAVTLATRAYMNTELQEITNAA